MAKKEEKDAEVRSKRPVNGNKEKVKMPDHLEKTVIAIVTSLLILMMAFVLSSNWNPIKETWHDFWNGEEPLIETTIETATLEAPVEELPPEPVVEAEEVVEPTPVPTGLDRTIASRIAHSGDDKGLDCMIISPEYSTELEYGAQRRGCEYTVVPQSDEIALCVKDIGCHYLSEDNL